MADSTKVPDGPHHQFIELLYREPITSGTRKIGWFLTVASLIVISTIALNLKVRAVPLLPWDFSLSDDQFRMISLLGVIALLIAFLVYALADIFQKKEIDHILRVRIDAQVKKWLQSKANTLIDEVFRPEEDDDDQDEFYSTVYAALRAYSEKSEKTTEAQVAKIIHRIGPLRLRNIRFWGAVSIPVILSMLSIWIGFRYVGLLMAAVVNSI